MTILSRIRPRFFNHPSPLRVLILTAIGERFGGSLLMALLTLYLTEQLRWPAEAALRGAGVFFGLSYALTLPGGWWADRGSRYSIAVFAGSLCLTGGYGFLVLGSTPACLLGLALLALGSGLYKPNLLALVGMLNEAGSERRIRDYSDFYAALNLAYLVAPPIGEWLRRSYGWDLAFLGVALLQLGTTAFFRMAWQRPCRIPVSAPSLPKKERSRLDRCLLLLSVFLWFWIALLQSNGTLVLFARDSTCRCVNLPLLRSIPCRPIPVGWFASVHAGLVIVFTPVLTRVLALLRRRGRVVSDSSQLALGMLLLAAAYGILAVPSWIAKGQLVNFGWLFGCYVALALAEILAGPLNYSFVSQCAPARCIGRFFGVSLLLLAAGSLLAGEISARFYADRPHHVYFTAFVTISGSLAALLLSMPGQQGRRMAKSG